MRVLLTGLAVAALCGCVSCGVPAGGRELCEGINPAVSPDGRKVAFQRHDGSVFKLGIYDLATGDVQWIEEGPGMAAYPAWTPTGGLVYTYGHDPKTSYQSWKEGATNTYNLRRWEDGRKTALTTGRCRDYTPTVSPDGKKVYFTTTRWLTTTNKGFSVADTTEIGCVDLDGGEPTKVLPSPQGRNSGVVSPAVSPDGQTLVWGHMQSFFLYWRIYGAKLSDTRKSAWCPVTPEGLVAYSPSWHPNGRYICFTGFKKDDPGWGVWVEDVTNGRVKRLCTGQNAVFSPDGKWLVYDQDRKIRMRPFTAADAPDQTFAFESAEDLGAEKVLCRQDGPLAKEFTTAGEQYAFGTGTFFARARFTWDGTDKLRWIARGLYEESDQGWQLYVGKDNFWFASCNQSKRFEGACIKTAAIKPGEHVVTGIRTNSGMYLSIDDAPPVCVPNGNLMPLRHPIKVVFAKDLHAGESLKDAEVGTGWPRNVPRPGKREDLFK